MAQQQAAQQTHTLQIDGILYYLAQDQDPQQLCHNAIAATKEGGGAATFTDVGNREITSVVSPGVPVILVTPERPVHDRDDADLAAPFGQEEWVQRRFRSTRRSRRRGATPARARRSAPGCTKR